MAKVNLRTLVLNRNYQPISLWPLSTYDAVDELFDYLLGKTTVIYSYNRKVLTPSRDDLYWPSVTVHHKHSDKKEIRLKRQALFYRDHGRCIFCSAELTINSMTREHIVPKSKGGGYSWDNIGAACDSCNTKKSNNLPVGKWKPKQQAYAPTFSQLLANRRRMPIEIDDERWIEFLPRWEANIIVKNPETGEKKIIKG